MKIISKNLLLLAALGGLIRTGFACDSCALYVAEVRAHPGFTVAMAEQFTRFGTVWSGHQRLGNPVDQYLESSITQLVLGHGRGGPWQAQFTLPWVERSYRRPDHALIESGTERGWGDAVLSARRRLWRWSVANGGLELNALGGVKFATGDASHLGDEVGHHFHHHDGFPDSGIHGHDLAAGSGSTDFVGGIDGQGQRGRFFVRGSLQYKLRRPGAFDYRMADETSWEIGPGALFALTPTHSLAVQAVFAAEHKGLDTLAGEPQADTGFNARYLGGRVTGTLAGNLTIEASAELPVRLRTTETMVVPDYRLRAAIAWRF